MPTDAPFPTRTFGVLLHPSSFPGRDRIGTIGAEARAFVDWLATTGAGIWQILPLTVNGKDDSPYFSSSAFAGNPWLIDLDDLHTAGIADEPQFVDVGAPDRVDFDELRSHKWPQLQAAAERFLAMPDHAWQPGFDDFVQGADWLDGACHFFALKDHHGDAPWWEWPEALRRCDADALAGSRLELADEMARWRAILYFFDRQWLTLKRQANQHGIRVLGDLPIYVAPDSADVWLHQGEFQVDDSGRLAVQSGVPPDYFSETGQLWGNPLYRWDVMAADGYSWWISRLRRCLELGDIVRIDHFRALAAYWEVPGDADTAIGGRWVDGPDQSFLDAVLTAFPERPIVAEDLGLLDDDVHRLRDDNRLPGMRVLQFGFDGDPDNMHLPHHFPERSITYTGTHDNDTLASWWVDLGADERARAATYLGVPADAGPDDIIWPAIEATMASRAVAAVTPVQDLLALDDRARMNVPSTTTGNWSWRMTDDPLDPDLASSLRQVAERCGRT